MKWWTGCRPSQAWGSERQAFDTLLDGLARAALARGGSAEEEAGAGERTGCPAGIYSRADGTGEQTPSVAEGRSRGCGQASLLCADRCGAAGSRGGAPANSRRTDLNSWHRTGEGRTLRSGNCGDFPRRRQVASWGPGQLGSRDASRRRATESNCATPPHSACAQTKSLRSLASEVDQGHRGRISPTLRCALHYMPFGWRPVSLATVCS